MPAEINAKYMPAQLAKSLHISVPTLRKYSLLIEKITDNRRYFARNKQNVRTYSEANLKDLQHLVTLSKQKNMTLQSAAQQIFAAKGQGTPAPKTATTKTSSSHTQMVAIRELQTKLLTMQQALTKLTQRVDQLETQKPVQQPTSMTSAQPDPQPVVNRHQAKDNGQSEEESGLDFTEPLPSDDPAAASEETHHHQFADEADTEPKSTADETSSVEKSTESDAAERAPKAKKHSWWQKMLKGRD